MKIISIKDNLVKIKNKKVLLRLDLNVPMLGAKIKNDYKLRSVLPTINFLLKQHCSIIILTHLGEPQLPLSKNDYKKYSVSSLAKWLSKNLSSKLEVLPMDFKIMAKKVRQMKKREIVMMENIRFFKGETDNDKTLAKRLASLADIYVNDAFAVCHREHVSVSAIKKFLPSYAGILLTNEIINLEKAKVGKKPLILIMGGAKLSTKLPLLKTLASKAKIVLTGGGIANTILKARGQEVGRSLFDQKSIASYNQAKLKNILTPIDLGVLAGRRRLVRKINEVKSADKIFDIGPKTVALYNKNIMKAKTIIWNGPMGLFEKKAFAKGNNAIALTVIKATKKGAFSLIGGGETVASIDKAKNNFSWVSTGGGASLSYLEGKKLPGLIGLIK